ncbi:MAG: hypothetical protein KAV41_00885 [Candidatus Pacebacteria bacterium]|nr:hypothetical protein [Candidatus Paceibacterota bacterium]
MDTQIAFKINKDMKDLAMQKANAEGITLSVFLKLAVRSFVDGQLGLGVLNNSEVFNKKTQKELMEIDKDIKVSRNLSPSFSNVKDAVNYLKNAS